jgi:hypothetical protein
MCGTNRRERLRRSAGLLAALALLTGAGCASHNAPSGFLSKARESGSDPFGAWIDLKVLPVAGERGRVQGELLAVTADSLWVLQADGGTVLRTQAVIEGQLTAYDSEAGQVGAATALGTVSTVSNGAFLVFTAPMWLIAGPITTSGQAKVPIKELPPLRWTDLAAHARFPQGIPEGVDWRSLRGKPLQPKPERR